MEHGEEGLGDALHVGKIESNTTKPEVDDASAMCGLVSKDSVGVGAGHGDPFGFARSRVDTGLFGNNGERRLRVKRGSGRRLESGLRLGSRRFGG